MRPGPALAPPGPPPGVGAMAFTFAAFCYMLTLVLCASLIFFVIWHVRPGWGWGRGGGRGRTEREGTRRMDGVRAQGNLEIPLCAPRPAGFCWPH